MYYSWMFEPLPNLLFFSASSLNPNWAGFLLAVGIIAQIVSRIATKRKSFVYNWDVWFPEFAVEDVICYPFSAGKFSLKSVNLESKFWSFHFNQKPTKIFLYFCPSSLKWVKSKKECKLLNHICMYRTRAIITRGLYIFTPFFSAR